MHENSRTPNADLLARLPDLSPVCIESILRERQLLSPRRINDMTRAAVTPETGRRHSRGGGSSSSVWRVGMVLNNICLNDSG